MKGLCHGYICKLWLSSHVSQFDAVPWCRTMQYLFLAISKLTYSVKVILLPQALDHRSQSRNMEIISEKTGSQKFISRQALHCLAVQAPNEQIKTCLANAKSEDYGIVATQSMTPVSNILMTQNLNLGRYPCCSWNVDSDITLAYHQLLVETASQVSRSGAWVS